MKVLIVCRSKKGNVAPYITRQVESIRNLGIQTEYFLIRQKDWTGYLKNLPGLYNKIDEFHPDIIHAHYGYSGLFAVLQRQIPVITTFHGSDINYPRSHFLSKMAMRFSAWSLFVSAKLAKKADAKRNFSIIPCGIDLDIFHPISKEQARQKTGILSGEKVILFSSSSANQVKNFPLAAAAVERFNQANPDNPPARLMELIGYSQNEVKLLLNACDVALLTSSSEGSPMFIKEAMACNRPIVSTDVGDVRSLTEGIPGCFIAKKNPVDIADKIRQALQFENSVGARQRIIDLGLEINETARKIKEAYEKVLKKNRKNIRIDQ